MLGTYNEPISVFLSSAPEDEELLKKFKTSLRSLGDIICVWADSDINLGQEQTKEISAQLNAADLILLLISPDYIASDHCNKVMQRALQRRSSKVCVIPIILRHGHYMNVQFHGLQTLPGIDKPITSREWSDSDEAFQYVVTGIHKAIEELLKSRHVQVTDQPDLTTRVLPPLHEEYVLPEVPLSALIARNPRGCFFKVKWPSIIVIFFIITTLSIIAFAHIYPAPITVMITPNNNTLNDNYLITAVTGVPNASQGQIQARVFSFTTPPQSKTVGATGIMQKAGVKAIGKLTFYNGMTTDQTVPIGTPFYVHGVTVVNLVDAQIPAAVPPMMGQITVPAQAINVGSDGNVAALAINQPCCSSNNTIFVRNLSAFTGGQDDLDYTFVKQSDIEGAASSLDQSLTPSARSSLQTQVHSNEALIASPQCAKKVSSNHNVGDRVDKVDVTVVITCTGEVYDKQALEKMTTNLLKQEATQKLSANYVLVDNMVKTKVTRITVVDSVKGMKTSAD
ncbi:MAG: TIR domain-containing protein [Chloroflexi bacterium]|nr:MAG: TIR domain-containing protein [Chloroflexota bacterium]